MSPYRITEKRFINPYNFVSIDEAVVRSEPQTGTLSGVITCELETLTPLFIPNTSRAEAFGENELRSYDFYSYQEVNGKTNGKDHRPILPGSSLRGAIRSAFEAVTNSCMVSCDDENTLYRRTSVPRKFFGIIEKDETTGERVLYKATKIERDEKLRGDHQTGEALDRGIYLRGEVGPKKKYDAIMCYKPGKDGRCKDEETRFSEDDRQWTNFLEVWRLYQNKQGAIKGVNENDDHYGYPGLLTADKIPVYYTYLDGKEFLYIAPAALTKEVFSRTIKELLILQGEHQPCDDGETLCPACNLFGMVGKTARASRLMFRDGTPNTNDESWKEWYEEARILPILANPKITATEFYMQEVKGAAYYNYDYSVQYARVGNGQGKPKNEAVRSHLRQPKLRGRKFYWHRPSVMPATGEPNAKMQVKVRPVKAGKRFQHEIAFDRLTKAELETLLWVLTFGEQNGTHAHKLGHAKPYGYGSVRIIRAKVTLRRLDEDLVLREESGDMYQAKQPADSLALAEYLKMTNFDEASEAVRYPRAKKENKDETIYDWFGINKEIQRGGMTPQFNYVLPKPLDDPLYLPEYESGMGSKWEKRRIVWEAPVRERQAVEHEAEAARQKQARAAARQVGQTIKYYDFVKIRAALENYETCHVSRCRLIRFSNDCKADPVLREKHHMLYEEVKARYKG